MIESPAVSAHAIGVTNFCHRLASQLNHAGIVIPTSLVAIQEKEAIVSFHKAWVLETRSSSDVNLGRLKAVLKAAEASAVGQTAQGDSRRGVQSAIQLAAGQILSLAKSMASNGCVGTDALFDSYFGGRPEFSQRLEGSGILADVDIIARADGRSRVWRFVPEDGLNLATNKRLKDSFILEAAATAFACEAAHSDECDATVVFDGIPKTLRLTPHLQERIIAARETIVGHKPEHFPTERCASCEFESELCSQFCHRDEDNSTEAVKAVEPGVLSSSESRAKEAAELEPVGRIIQNVSRQLAIQVEKKRLFGYLYEERAEEVHVGEVLTAVSESDHSSRLMCRVVEAKSSQLSASIPTKSVEGFVCNVALEPVGVVKGIALDEVPNANFDGYVLCRPTVDDYNALYNLPSHGIPMGFITSPASESSIPYLYDPSQAFKSFFVCGGQGTGKTNFMRYFVRTYTKSLSPGPAIVILDVEGQFVNIKKSLDANEGCTASVEVMRVGSPESDGDVTLSFRAVGEKYLPHFVPELPIRTTEMLERIAHDVFAEIASKGEQPVVQKVLREISTRATRDGKLHFSQRGAIQRATGSPTFNIFDQPGLDPLSAKLLLIPGRVSVIDVSELSEDEQRVVAIYLMAILFEAKMKSHREGQPTSDVLLLIDEAHRLFPQNRGLKRDYVVRVAKFVEEVTHRGRKRNYGIMLATQSPGDISQSIVGLCETKLFFRVAGHQIWLREHVGDRETVKAIGDLPNFKGYIIVKGSSCEPVNIGFPNVSDGIETGTELAPR